MKKWISWGHYGVGLPEFDKEGNIIDKNKVVKYTKYYYLLIGNKIRITIVGKEYEYNNNSKL